MIPYDSFVLAERAMTVTNSAHRRFRPWQTVPQALLFPLLVLAACQTLSPPEETAVLPVPVDIGVTLPADAPRFMVDPEASEIRLLVYRTGPLARFGHNHVTTGRVRGEIRAGVGAVASGFRLEVPVESFVVDPPAARVEEGDEFATEVSEQARQGTRENMLGKDVLDAASHPLIQIDSLALVGPRWNPTVLARVTLHGATRDVRFPAAVIQQEDLLTVVANLRVRQSDFGVTPFTTLGAGLQVRDIIDIRIRLIARRAG
jgi:polyisoprenoid-binding protein YceI